MRIRKRVPEDIHQMLQLLKAEALPPDGLEQTEGWVLEGNGQVLGHVALESTMEAIVLRSLVVDPSQRGQGFGEQLMAEAESEARGRSVILKTETVGPWMERRGYRRTTPDQLPVSVRSTTQFSGTLCSGTPIYQKENIMENDTIKAAVREHYAGFAKNNSGCCGPSTKKCGCSGFLDDPSLKIGYAIQDIEAAPEGANLGLGCGNPVALATLQPGEVVLDLGSGAGFDAFLASKRVGAKGRVIGVDMTPEMIARARGLAEQHGYANVEFHQGDIEQLPVEDASVDAIISNCVINLTTDKAKTFREAFRVLKVGGRLMVSDLVLLRSLPDFLRRDMETYAACVGGALLKEDYVTAIQAAGFTDIQIVKESGYDLGDSDPEAIRALQEKNPEITLEDWKAAAGSVVSIQVQAFKRTAVQTKQPDCCASCCPSE